MYAIGSIRFSDECVTSNLPKPSVSVHKLIKSSILLLITPLHTISLIRELFMNYSNLNIYFYKKYIKFSFKTQQCSSPAY